MASDKRSLASEEGIQKVELHRPGSISEDIVIIDVRTGNSAPHNVYSYTWTNVSNFIRALRGMKVEVVMFIYLFAFIVRNVNAGNMIIDKVCRVHLGYTDDVCKNLKLHKTIKDEVTKMANNYQLAHTLTQLVPSALLSPLIGAWSDRYGRKAPIIVALVGILLEGIGTTLCAYYMHSRVEFFVISAAFTGVSGGFISVMTVLYSYSSDITAKTNRTMKYAFLEFAFGLSKPLGALVGGWLYKWSGYVEVFITSTAGHFFGLLWVVFVLEETKGLDCKESWREKFRNFWSIKALVSSFRAATKVRPNKGKQQIIGLIVAMSFMIFSYASTANFDFFYVHNVYDWDNTTYSTITAVFSTTGLLTMMVAVPLSKRFKLSDPILGLIGSVSNMLKYVCMGLGFWKEVYFLGNFLGLLSSLAALAGRSRISKVSSKNDIGKIFSFLTTAESLLPILAAAAVSQIFNATLSFFAGLAYLLAALLFVVPIVIFIWIWRLPAVDYDQPDEEELDPPEENSNTETKKS